MNRNPLSPKSLITRTLVAVAATVPFVVPASSASAVAATAPTAPQNISAIVSGTSINVSWSAPASNGGAAITGYVATSVPGGATCTTTTETSCTLTNLRPGRFYSVIVRAKNAVDLGDGDSVDVTTGLLATSVGSRVKVTKSPAATVASNIEIARSGRTVTVAVVAPSNVKRYHLSLFTVAGEKSVVSAAWAKSGRIATMKAHATSAGRYRVVVTATRIDGSKVNWNGPVVTLK